MQIKGMLSRLFKGQRGAAMTELLVSLPALLLMGLGGLQSALLFDAKTTINYATFEAARKGAVNHAQSDAMRRELGLRLAPLFGGDGSAEKALSAITRASLDVQDSRFTEIEIINPTIEAFDEFGREIVDPRTGDVHFGIPNSHLRWRERDVGRSGVNIQDANLLKVKVTYGYQLKVPLMDRVIPAVMRLVDPQNIHYYNARRLPITSVATVRMQSDAWRDDNNVHMIPPGGGGTPPSTEDDPQNGGATPDDDEGQGGDDNDTDTPTDGDEQATGEGDSGTGDPSSGDTDTGDSGNGNNSDGDDLPSISDGDDQGPPPCDPDDAPGLTDSPTAQNAGIASSHTGNPIHVVTGNKYQQEVDLTPLPGTLGLLFKRHYNSHSQYTGPLGHGWSHSYDLSLKPDGDGYRLRQSDGRVIHFQPSDTPDQFIAPRISDGWLRINEVQLTWHWRDGRQLQFSPQGQLQRIVLATGQTLRLFYNPQGKLFLVRDPQGRELSLDHYPNGRLKALYDPSGKETRYRYDDVGNLQQVTRHEGTTRIYHYEDPHDRHNLTGITDERGIRYASWAYDDKDRAVLSTHADQVGQVSLDFSSPGETKVTDSQGKVSTYTTEIRNGVARVTAIQDPGCSSCGPGDVSYRYNEQLQLIELATKDGITKHYEYDEQGRTTLVTRKAGGQPPETLARYEYANESSLKPSAVIRPSINPQGEHRLTNVYNPQGQPTQLTEQGYRPETDGGYTPIERTTRLDYNEAGNLIAIDGPREDVEDRLQISYDKQQRLSQLKTPDGRTLRVTQYDVYGRPLQVHGSGQALLTLSYNTRGKVTRATQGQQTVKYGYDAIGNLTAITDPDGKQIRLNYDEAGRATGLEDDNGNRIDQAIDTEGRLTQRSLKDTQGQLLATVSYLYDAQGRLSVSESPQGKTHYRYDDAGNLTEVEDPQGYATALDYNGLGQLLAVTQPGNRVTQLHYDEHGRASGLTDPRENTTQIVKDDFGHVIRQSHPDTGEVRYAYDRAGNRIQKTDAQDTTTRYRYDAANRLIEETSPSGTTSLDYDPNSGRLAQLTDGNSHEGFAYDDQGRLIQHSRHIDGHRFITQYAYNAQGKLSQKSLPDGQVLTYHYYEDGNQKGQLRAISRDSLLGLREAPLVGEIDQDASDGETGMTFGNGLKETKHHDKLGRVTAIDHSRQLKLQYQYDEQGRITGIDYNGIQQNYDYDLFGRLTQAETNLGSYRYDYDSLGNRTYKEHADQDGNITTQENRYPDPGEGNRLLSQENGESQAYRYNASGSPKQIGERRYEYDAQQRLIRLYRVDPDDPENKTLVAEYTYNRFGERIKKVVYTYSKRPKVTYYLYDGHHLTAEVDDSGKVTAQYLYQQHRPIIKLEGKIAYAIHTDHLGAPRAVTDEDQQIVWSADYSPFGLIRIEQQVITLNLRLPGQYEDQESGTYYNYQRDYDPNIGRYLTSDPIGLKGGLNTYAYVGGNPLNTIDPLGLYWEIVNGIPQWVPDGPDGSTEPVNIFDLYPMPGTSEIDAGELTDYLSTLEREEYGDRLIEDFASTGAPDICIRDVNVPEEFQFGLGNLRGGTGLPGIIYGDTIDGVLAQYTDQPFNMGSIHGWVRNGNQLQLHYPGLSDTQVDVVGIAIGHLPAYGGERMHIAIPAGASDEQIAEELMMSLGSLLTHEDVVAFLANLPQERNEPLLVDIYELYQEILARYQTRLHSDERVWHAEIDANRNQEALNAHIQEHGETLDCGGRVQTTDAAVCQRRDILEREAEEAMERYIEALQTVNNEMIDNGLMPLMDEQMSNQSQAREMFAATTVAAVGIFVPLTLQDVAIDAMTAGLGRIRRVGEALEDMVRVVRGAGRAELNRVRNVTDEVVDRIQANRRENVWDLRPTDRGDAIENELARTEYSDWYHVGEEYNGYFDLVDFQNGNTLVSLKTVDTSGSTWIGRMQGHIRDLGSGRSTVDGQPANMVLDLRVQPGGTEAANELIEFGIEHGVSVRIREF